MAKETTRAEWLTGLRTIREQFDRQRVQHSQLKAAWFYSDDRETAPRAIAEIGLTQLYPSSRCEYGSISAPGMFDAGGFSPLHVVLIGPDAERESFKAWSKLAGSEFGIRPRRSPVSEFVPDAFLNCHDNRAPWFVWVAQAIAIGRGRPDPRLAIERFSPDVAVRSKWQQISGRLADQRPDLFERIPNECYLGWPGLEAIASGSRFDQHCTIGGTYSGPPVIGWRTLHDLWTVSDAALEIVLSAMNTSPATAASPIDPTKARDDFLASLPRKYRALAAEVIERPGLSESELDSVKSSSTKKKILPDLVKHYGFTSGQHGYRPPPILEMIEITRRNSIGT